ncbi:MAG: glycosyltransferase family 2 protein, partial [Planctomycetia bacterium]
MNDAPTLSIVIPTYDGWPLLQRCLASVAKHRPADAEVIVVDDASTDGTADRVAASHPLVRVVRCDANGGFCRAANLGWRAARAPVVEMLNNDTEVSAGWTVAPLAAFADPAVGLVAPLVCRLPFRGRIDSAGDVFWTPGLAWKRAEGRPASTADRLSTDVFGASASSAFYRRDALERVGGFPEHFGAYLDDVDVDHRLRLAGYTCRFTSASRVYHWVSQSHRVDDRRLQRRFARNAEHVFWSNLPASRLATFAGPHVALVLTQLAHKAVRGGFGPYLAGKMEAAAETAAIWRRRRFAQGLARTAPPPYTMREPKGNGPPNRRSSLAAAFLSGASSS